MSNHYIYARRFCTGFGKKLLELIDDPEDVYMLWIATSLEGTCRSVKFMEATWSAECGVVARVEADNNAMGKVQGFF